MRTLVWSFVFSCVPVCFIQENNFVSRRGKGHLSLCKHFDAISDNINPSTDVMFI